MASKGRNDIEASVGVIAIVFTSRESSSRSTDNIITCIAS